MITLTPDRPRVKPAPTPVATPFVPALAAPARVVKSWDAGGLQFAATVDEANPGHYAFFLYVGREGRLIKRHGCDTLGEAETHAYILSTPLPTCGVAARAAMFEPADAGVMPARRRIAPAMAKATRWAGFAPAPIRGGAPDDRTVEFGYLVEHLADPDAPELSDDVNGQFGWARD